MLARTKGQPDGNSLLDHTAYWMHRLSSSVLHRFEKSLSEAGVTVAQWKVMMVLHHGDASTTFSIANFIDVDAGSVTRVIDRLEAKGMLARAPNAEDRRTTDVTLTERGRRLLQETLLPIADAQDNAWLRTLSPAELLVFKGLLARLLEAQAISTPQRWVRSGLCTEPRE